MRTGLLIRHSRCSRFLRKTSTTRSKILNKTFCFNRLCVKWVLQFWCIQRNCIIDKVWGKIFPDVDFSCWKINIGNGSNGSDGRIFLIDSHAHLTSTDRLPDLEAILERAKEAHVHQIINICTDPRSLEVGLALEKRCPWIRNAGSTPP